ncbi:MAG: PAS domain S-box protein [Deltaproteobacteria bacterium]|nr:PAS domain S-box protein [Deltaproteobacteria bacterium]
MIRGKRHIILLFIVFFFGYMLFSIYEEVKHKTIDEFNSQQLILAKQAARGIENYFKHFFLELTYLTSFNDVILSNQRGRKILTDFYKINSDQINAITHVNAAGKIIYTVPSNSNAIGVDISHQNHVQTIIKTHKPVISDVFMAVQGYNAVAYHVPIIENEVYQGSLAVLIPFDRLTNESLANIKIRKSGYAWVISKKGIELFCPISSHVGTTVAENLNEFPGLLAMAEKMKQGKNGVARYVDGKLPGKSMRQAAYFPINLGNTHWSIAVTTPEKEVLSTMKGFRNKWLLITIMLGLAAIIYSYLAFRSWNILKDEKNRKARDIVLRNSEEKYRELAQSSNSIILKTDQNYNITFFNKYAQEFFGFSEDEIIGKNLVGTIVPEIESSGRNLKKIMEEMFENPEAFADNENENIRKNGERVWVAWRNKGIYNDKGKLSGVLCTGYNITMRKQIESAIKKERDMVAAILWWIESIVVVLDLNGNVISFNRAAERCSGYSSEEVSKKPFWETLIPLSEREGVKDSVLNVKPNSFPNENENHWVTKNGQERLIQWYNSILTKEDGSIEYILCTGLDITERNKAEEQLKRAHTELELRVKERTEELNQSLTTLKQTQQELIRSERLAALGNMVAGIAHEISTPLGIGVTEASFINDNTNDITEMDQSETLDHSSFKEYLKIVSESSSSILNNLTRSADLIKSFKQVAVDQTIFEQRTFAFKEYINGVVLSLKPEFRQTQHKISIECPDEIFINSHPGAFAQITTNLIRNSLLHGFNGVDQGEIKFKIKANNHHLTFHYCDNGIGMDEINLKQVFDPFFTTKRNRGGTGLGMNIVYNLVTQKLNGDITCNSSVGKGVEVIIKVPLDKKEIEPLL